MKNKLLILLLFTISISAKSQIEITGKWKIDFLISAENQNNYKLTKPQENVFYDRYGNFLELRENGTFTSFNAAPCGNDCFHTNSGKYYIKNEKNISFQILHLNVSGDCENIDKEVDIEIGLFEIIKNDDFIKLVRIN
jgi:hypothetical protein